MRSIISLFATLVITSSAMAQTAYSALNEVTVTRAARGLPPFTENRGLTTAAMNVARYRASHLLTGHTSNNFRFLPPGTSASAAGCAAWEPSLGWGACCTYEHWQFAGAAWAMGSNGRRYMHIFVR